MHGSLECGIQRGIGTPLEIERGKLKNARVSLSLLTKML